jgi:hypothetical protein
MTRSFGSRMRNWLNRRGEVAVAERSGDPGEVRVELLGEGADLGPVALAARGAGSHIE